MRAVAMKGIVIVGMDANPQARDAIAAGGSFEASMAQDFEGIGAAAAEAVARLVSGETITAPRHLRAHGAHHCGQRRRVGAASSRSMGRPGRAAPFF